MSTAELREILHVEGDHDAACEAIEQKGWSDGLPVVLPTAERVRAMLQYCDRPWDEPIAKIAPRYGHATPTRLAANAVMAGCRPQYFPLVMLSIEAICEEPFNLYSLQATTHNCAPLVIVNGPVARELDINGGTGAFGPGRRSNATIGRALRLALLNIGGGIPGFGDMATMGSPSKFSYLVAENEAVNPWEPLHVERGLPLEASAVTVIGGESPHNINDHESTNAEGLLHTIAGSMRSLGINDNYHQWRSQPLVILAPEHARVIADAGYSKLDVKRYLYEHTKLRLGDFSPENIERRFRGKFDIYRDATLDEAVPLVRQPEDLLIAVIGGAGKHSAFVPTFGATKPVTRALKRRDGSYAASVEDFRQK